MSTTDNTDQETHAPMLRRGDISALTLSRESPCISIYVPTTPVSNYREENRILYKDQVKKVVAALDARNMDKYLRADLVERLESVGTNEIFWTHQQYGLAVFASDERFMVRRMMRGPDEAQGIVAESFHLRPALRETADWMHYQVLCVSLHDVALYDCSQENMVEVELHEEVPRGMGDALGKTENSVNREGSGRSGDDSKVLKRYFQAVDQAIQTHHGNRGGRPLILAAVAEYQGLFREVSNNPALLEVGLDKEPFEEIRNNRLGAATWDIAGDSMHQESIRWVQQYEQRQAHGEGESELEKVAYAATIGQIETVLIDESARVEGTIDGSRGIVEYGTPEDTATDDVLDAIAENVLYFDGEIRFIPSDRMPTDTGVAAVLRFAMHPE